MNAAWLEPAWLPTFPRTPRTARIQPSNGPQPTEPPHLP